MLIFCLLLLRWTHCLLGFCVWSLFVINAVGVFIILSSFAIISLRKRELVALLKLCSCVAVGVLCLDLAVPLVGLQCVI